MNNVSAKREIKSCLLTAAILSTVWVLLVLFQVTGFLAVLIWILPLFCIISLGAAFGELLVADINLDEANGILIVTKVLKEKKLPLKDLKITGHSYLGGPCFIFNTNKMEITTRRTRGNYDKLIRLFELTNYEGINRFKAQVQKLIDFSGFEVALPLD